MKVVDYSITHPDPRVLVDAGYVGVMRYCGYDNRCITAREQDALHTAGLKIGYVFEGQANGALGGFEAGRADAEFTNRFLEGLGVPTWVPVFSPTVDIDATDAQIRLPIASNGRGWLAANHRPTRPYGKKRVLDLLCGELGLFPCGWQSVAWSGGLISPYACMFQHYGGPIASTDHNDILMPEDFLWHPDSPAPTPPIPPTPEDNEMLTEEEWRRLTTLLNIGFEQWGNKFATQEQLSDVVAGAKTAEIIHHYLKPIAEKVGVELAPFTVNVDD